MIDSHHGWNVSLKPSFLGFILSLLLLFSAYQIVVNEHLSDGALMFTVVGIAFLQAVLQLIFFLHLGLETKPHWNTITFLFTVLIILIVIGGSLWIMNNLSYNLMMDMGTEKVAP